MVVMNPVYSVRFIFMSIGVAYIGAYVTICLCEQFRLCTSALTKPKLLGRRGLLVMMACSMGGVGIWTMHFIGMSSITLKDPNGVQIDIKYNLFRTIMSLISVVILSFIGLYVGSFDQVFSKTKQEIINMFVHDSSKLSMVEIKRIKNTRLLMLISSQSLTYLLIGGFCAGAGVCLMHYLGFWAMEFHGVVVYNWGIVAASLLIALLAEIIAFWILFRLLSLYPHLEILRIGSACAMAIAACGMHYTGMAAATFEYQEDYSPISGYGPLNGSMNSYDAFFGTLTVATIFVITLMKFALADLRAWHYNVLKHLQRADDLILQMQKDTPAHNAHMINNYLIQKQTENNTFRSSHTVSSRPGILLKPAPSNRRQFSGNNFNNFNVTVPGNDNSYGGNNGNSTSFKTHTLQRQRSTDLEQGLNSAENLLSVHSVHSMHSTYSHDTGNPHLFKTTSNDSGYNNAVSTRYVPRISGVVLEGKDEIHSEVSEFVTSTNVPNTDNSDSCKLLQPEESLEANEAELNV